MKINKSEYGRRYGVNESTIRSYIERGMPDDDEAAATEWIVTNVIQPLRDTDTKEQIEQQRLRKMKAEADMAEAELNERLELLIPQQEVEQEVGKWVLAVRNYIRSLPNRISTELFEQESQSKMKRVLSQRIDEMLTEIGSLTYENDEYTIKPNKED